ncbi:MAG: O-antigen ligase family protein, partial [Pseudolabrys sp.]
MQSAAPGLAINLFKTRNIVFFLAVLLMHWTLPRPAPADVLFLAVLYLSIVVNPPINIKFMVFFVLIFVWTICVFFASIHVIDERPVQFQLLAHTFVSLLGLTTALTALSWREDSFHTFIKVYLVACCIAAGVGIFGFAGHVDYFLWDGRAKALFDEPIAFGAFLLPGVLGSMYLLSRGEGKLFPFIALGLSTVGVLLSFSRAAIFSLFLFAPVYFIVANRRNLGKALFYLVLGAAIAAIVMVIALASFEGFQEKVFDRLTVAKSYDSAPGGRFSRYIMSIPLILQNPTGLGMLQIDKYFSEPVHDIFLSSFVNYGWLAGVVWILFTILSFKIAFDNQRATGSPVAMWVAFSVLSQLPCAILQQVEHWRHLWMFLGLLWGFNIRNFQAAGSKVGGQRHPPL